ncbi:putative ATP synthase subunit f, mitochondrial [Bradysia coprophila]|uniref:putative ATP synthase subunit f, mitochondrial n=1 Tax=Bradysia coprophila TaxID=38358 RepID=UPI00187D7F42|nr:putative ATP synthase subunit f, mitochondrial [Bradysia coprophila]
MGFGDYPPEYDAKHHGPYNPARYYGKRDIPFSNVKLGELAAWLSRREKSPHALVAMVSRAWWRWNHKYVMPRRAGIAPLFHLIGGSCLFCYIINYGSIKHHRNYKYH